MKIAKLQKLGLVALILGVLLATVPGAVSAGGPAPYERVEKKNFGYVYYLNCQQAQTFEKVAGSYDAARNWLGSKGPTAWKIGVKISQWLGFTNISAENVRKANYTNPAKRQGCRGIRIGEAKVGPFTVGLLVAPR